MTLHETHGFQGRPCQHCGRLHTRKGLYCSAACRQAAYRRRVDPGIGEPGRRSVGAINGVQTKRDHVTLIKCQQCGASIMIDATESARLYCSAACKQAAYRARRNSQ